MSSLAHLPIWDKQKFLHIVVETPRYSRAKFAFDPELQTFVLTKPLLHGLSYPYDWGFVPSTKGADGDPLDAIVIHEAVTYPGTVIKCQVLGVLEVSQSENGKTLRNDRIIATPANDKRIEKLTDITRAVRKELQQFFLATHTLDRTELRFLGWKGPSIAYRLIKNAALSKQ
jgi:inorganic pyrophosphatase